MPKTPPKKSVFEVDKKGLAKLLERRGKEFAILELFQNAVDEDGVTQVKMTLSPSIPDADGNTRYDLIVEDNSPEGFADMKHAYTLFAESNKKGRADQRGRFNLGEKLVIAVCDWVQISTTKGLIEFTDEGRTELPSVRDVGSVFHGILKMTDDEAAIAEAAVETLLVPGHISATINGRDLESRIPVRTFQTTLRTELADAEGRLRPTRRKTDVSIYEPKEGEVAHLYEMGIPVVPTDDRWHVDIAQKVPLNTDRDNVPPGWLRDVRVAVLNNCADALSEEDTKAKWVDDAAEDEAVEATAIQAVVKGRYGDKAVIEDRTDPEGTKMAMSQGHTVIPGGAFSKAAWGNIKKHETVKPAGQVTPSPNPDMGFKGSKLMEPEHWTKGIKEIADLSQRLAKELLGKDIKVQIQTDITWPYSATWRRSNSRIPAELTFNYGRLGHKWFSAGATEKVLALLIHEMAHEAVSDHLTSAFYDETCRLGARLARAIAEDGTLLDIKAGVVA